MEPVKITVQREIYFFQRKEKKTETANLALACSRRSDGGERFIAFFTLHRSLLSERLEQANLARIFLLDAIDRLVVAWPWTGRVSFWNLIFHSLCSLRRWRNLASVYISWLSYFHLPLPCPCHAQPPPLYHVHGRFRENEAISTTGFLSSGYLFKLMELV